MNDRPAILDNKPVFEQALPFVRPTLPAYENLSGQAAEILSTGMLTKGKYLRDFEERLAAHLGVKHAVGVSSCTTGLMLTYQGLDLAGEVIVPGFTFMATVSALVWSGLRPIFVDVDFETTNIDAAQVEKAITPETSAIVAVHNFGNPAPIKELEEIAARHSLKLIFDAAHGFGALYRGQPVGRFGDAEVFSLSPTKLLVAGEGGIVATNDDELARRVRVGREYGNDGHYGTEFPGINARLAEFNAILGLESLEMLESNACGRNRVAALFRERLGQLPGVSFQRIEPQNRSSYKDFSIVIDESEFGLSRDQLAQALREEGVDTRNYYDPPVHLHKPYKIYFREGQALPVTEDLARRSISLPIYSHMNDETVYGICRAVERIYRHASEVKKALA